MRTALRNQVQEGNSCTLLVIVNRIYRQLPIELIVRIEAYGNFSWIYTRNGERYLTGQPILTIQRIIGGFWRVHRSHLINPSFVQKSFGSVRNDSLLKLTTGAIVPVSRRRKVGVCQQLRQLSR